MPEHSIKVEPHGLSFRAREGETILGAARRAGIWLPFECGWGDCGTCKLTLKEGEVRSLFPEAPAIKPQDERRNRILVCQSVALSDLVLQVKKKELDSPREDLPTEDYRGTLVSRREVGAGIYSLHFALDAPARFMPGQYAMVEFAPGLRRAYLIANLAGEERVELIVKRKEGGAASEHLLGLASGDDLLFEIPYGAGYYRETGRAPVFIACGVGIASTLAMLRWLAIHGDGETKPCYVFYGAPSSEELVLLDELEDLAHSLGAKLIPTVEQPGSGWKGKVGTVAEAIERFLPPPWEEYAFYAAGPESLVNGVLGVLKSAGIRVTRIRAESFGPGS